VIDENDLQDAKHCESRISTLFETKIDSSDDSENTDDSMRNNCEFDSNVTDESDLHFEKHFEQRISTLFGIKID
jgi:hypothetical protein